MRTVEVSAASCRFLGRTCLLEGCRALAQSGSGVETVISGSFASVTLRGVCFAERSQPPRCAVWIDGRRVAEALLDREREITLWRENRTATVRILLLSEAVYGAVEVRGFQVESELEAPLHPTVFTGIRAEFIGDSITCGYGVEAERAEAPFTTAQEDFTKTYAWLTSQALGLDCSAVCYSGYGIVSGYREDGVKDPGRLIPQRYPFAGAGGCAVAWDFGGNPRDLIVLNAGTNDEPYVMADFETRAAEFGRGYEAFLRLLREKNPAAKILCVIGVMGAGELFPYIEQAAANLQDSAIRCARLAEQVPEDGYGANWHPSVLTQQKTAQRLRAELASFL